MRTPPALPSELERRLKGQDGVITTAQAFAAGMSARQLRTLVAAGWRRPHRGVYVMPSPPDPFRASVRAALLTSPHAVAARVTAARLHGLWGVPRWTEGETPQLILPLGTTHNSRPGLRLHSGLMPGEATALDGLGVTTLDRTVRDLALVLPLDDLVCAVDSALRLGWSPGEQPRRGGRSLSAAVALADARSESPLETLARLVLVRAGLAPEELQWKLLGGRIRLDIAWPSVRLAIELDGRRYHDDPEPLYRDRDKSNGAVLTDWRLLRFTWYDVMRRPQWVVAAVRQALAAR